MSNLLYFSYESNQFSLLHGPGLSRTFWPINTRAISAFCMVIIEEVID